MQSVHAPCSFEKYTGTSDKKKKKKNEPTLWLNNNNIQTSSTLYIILAAAAAAVHQITKRAVQDVLFRVCVCVRTKILYRVSASLAVRARVLSCYAPALRR